MSKKILDFYAENGFSLRSKGINESVVSIYKIEAFFEICRSENILILGGDIYEKNQENNFSITYDNWFYVGCDSSESIAEASTYLNSIREEGLYVSFVLNK